MTDNLYFSDPACLQHDPRLLAPGHPESPERLVALERALRAHPPPRWERRQAPAAEPALAELVHTSGHVRRILDLCGEGGGAIDGDTFVDGASCGAALAAVGAISAMTRALMAGESRTAFCAVRPPGHHAEADRAMGFCLFNNVAIATELAIGELGASRVLIVDWDVHHGNGTAEIFRRRDDVLYASIHQAPFYPGTGPLHDAGSASGEGATINLPVPAGSDGSLWLSLLAHVVLPVAVEFAPQLVLVSAGFDAHLEDPLAGCRLQSATFADMATRVDELARSLGAPLGLVLEGGYNPPVLGECVCETLAALSGEPAARSPVPEAPGTAAALAQVRRHWPV
jgi:acetoin utilization deacetylase AcuC-like enzyme